MIWFLLILAAAVLVGYSLYNGIAVMATVGMLWTWAWPVTMWVLIVGGAVLGIIILGFIVEFGVPRWRRSFSRQISTWWDDL